MSDQSGPGGSSQLTERKPWITPRVSDIPMRETGSDASPTPIPS